MERESLRPRGTVEVTCSAPGCRLAFWLDPMDPRLPGGPFDCGTDHELAAVAEECQRTLWRDHGIAWGTWAMAPGHPCRVVGPDGRVGVYQWRTPDDMRDAASVAAAIAWTDDRPFGENTDAYVRDLRAAMEHL